MASPQELPNTYFVQDRSNEEELMRLQLQDQMLTTGMGGVLSEQPDPTIFKSVLDVGCGTGGWLIETAKAYPTIKRLVGVDISRRVALYAREQAERAGVADRVEFHVMDALRLLEFPNDSFDLVNERFDDSFLRIWDWPKFLRECLRVARPGGIIRATECDFPENNSPAVNCFCDLLLEAFYRSGHFFTLDRCSVIGQLASLLKRYGVRNVQTRSHRLEYRAGTVEWQSFYEDVKHGFNTLRPFLSKWSRVPADYEKIYQQALQEMQQPDFVAVWTLLTAWGNKE
jgi:ubiquinone/menaquinone biosynthesis C-methylase UbiE